MNKAIKCGKLFSAEDGKVLENKTIVVEGDRFKAVRDTDGFSFNGCEIVDLSGKFVMPGLIDCHMHLASDGSADNFRERATETLGDMTLKGLKNAQKQLKAGFTTIRNLGSPGFVDVSIKKAVDAGLFDGPRMVVSGPALSSTGGHGDSHFSPQLNYDPRFDQAMIIDGADAARKAARYVIKHGAGVVKFMATGGVMSMGTTLGAQQLTLSEMKAITETAEMYGVHTATHAHGTNGIKDAVRAGVTSVEHGMIMDEETVELMAEKGTYLSPTIIAARRIIDNGVAAGIQPYAVEKAKQAYERHGWGFRKCLEAGVTIVFGTDCGTPFNKHGEQFDEFIYLSEFGMSNIQILSAATKNAAMLLRVWDTQGSVTEGKFADICAFDANPADDIRNMKTLCFVMKGGVRVG